MRMKIGKTRMCVSEQTSWAEKKLTSSGQWQRSAISSRVNGSAGSLQLTENKHLTQQKSSKAAIAFVRETVGDVKCAHAYADDLSSVMCMILEFGNKKNCFMSKERLSYTVSELQATCFYLLRLKSIYISPQGCVIVIKKNRQLCNFAAPGKLSISHQNVFLFKLWELPISCQMYFFLFKSIISNI